MKFNICLKSMGMINALGDSPKEIWQELIKGDPTSLSKRKDLIAHKTVWVGEVKKDLTPLPSSFHAYQSRNSCLILEAYLQIKEQVRQTMAQVGAEKMGIVLGTSTSGIEEGEKAIFQWTKEEKLPSKYKHSQQELAAVSEVLKELSGIRGPAYTLSTACSSSAKVFSSAKNLLQLGNL